MLHLMRYNIQNLLVFTKWPHGDFLLQQEHSSAAHFTTTYLWSVSHGAAGPSTDNPASCKQFRNISITQEQHWRSNTHCSICTCIDLIKCQKPNELFTPLIPIGGYFSWYWARTELSLCTEKIIAHFIINTRN